MRRKDREITEREQLLFILQRENLLSLALCDEGKPYVVPLHYGVHLQGERVRLYLHSAKEGRKLNILLRNPNVCFSIVGKAELVLADEPCNCGTKFESLVGEGQAQLLMDHAQKAQGLACLMRQMVHKEFDFDEKMTRNVAVVCIEVTMLSGKRCMM